MTHRGRRGFSGAAELRRIPPLAAGTAAALAAGATLFPAAAAMNRLLGAWVSLPPFLSVIPEETLKIALALAFAAAARRRGTPQLALLAALGATAFGAAENLSYGMAFPGAYIYLRLGWSLPLHSNAGALFALALSGRRPVLAGAAAFAISCLVHGVFNALAQKNPSPGFLLGGIVFNIAACAFLAARAQARFASGGILDGITRV